MSSKLVIGTVQFGLPYGVANRSGLVVPEEAKRILAYAFSQGVEMLDTAVAYGQSEKVLGEIGVAKWRVMSKLPSIPSGTQRVGEWVRKVVAESLDRLRLPGLYALLLHRPDQILGPDGKQLTDALLDLKSSGLIEKTGISVYSPDELQRLLSCFNFDLVQAPLNILDTRLIDSGWAHSLNQSGVELHVRSVFLQGLLLMPPADRPKKFERWTKLWSTWDGWLEETRQTSLQACLSYVLSVPHVDKVVIGVENIAQLTEVIRATGCTLKSIPNWPVEIAPELINPSCWVNL